jgi:hypothetical protein
VVTHPFEKRTAFYADTPQAVNLIGAVNNPHSIPFFEAFPEAMAVDGEAADIGFKQQGCLFTSRGRAARTSDAASRPSQRWAAASSGSSPTSCTLEFIDVIRHPEHGEAGKAGISLLESARPMDTTTVSNGTDTSTRLLPADSANVDNNRRVHKRAVGLA